MKCDVLYNAACLMGLIEPPPAPVPLEDEKGLIYNIKTKKSKKKNKEGKKNKKTSKREEWERIIMEVEPQPTEQLYNPFTTPRTTTTTSNIQLQQQHRLNSPSFTKFPPSPTPASSSMISASATTTNITKTVTFSSPPLSRRDLITSAPPSFSRNSPTFSSLTTTTPDSYGNLIRRSTHPLDPPEPRYRKPKKGRVLISYEEI
jgi:hypothetical protein